MEALFKSSLKTYSRKSGIYLISCRDGMYIGSSLDLKDRLNNHKNCLKRGTHSNIILQRYFDKYGEELFFFMTLEYCEKNVLLTREKYFIDVLLPKFNIVKDPVTQYIPKQGKKVYQFTLDGEFVAEYRSTKEAQRITELSAIYAVASKKYGHKSIGGYLWSFDLLDIPVYENNSSKSKIKAVCKYSLIGTLLQEYSSIADAARVITEDNFDSVCANISSCAYKKVPSYKGNVYRFSGAEFSISDYLIFKKGFPIVQMSIAGEIIKIWENTATASSELNYKHMGIQRCVNGERKTHKGFIWKKLGT